MKKVLFKFENINKRQRVDHYISAKEKSLSRSKIQNLIQSDNLKINGISSNECSYKLKHGDKIELNIPPEKKPSLKPFDYKLDIFYEDEDLLIINKSSGISMHPGAGNYDNTIVNALINYGYKNLSNSHNSLRPGIVHRIDKDTSGLVVIAKNDNAHKNLSKQFSDHSIKRIYQTLVWGKLRPQNGKIETLITRNIKNRQLMAVGLSKGKKAITNYKTIEVFDNDKVPTFSLLECKLETGRTHQIRVHMSYKGNNILGDKKYKKKFKKFKNIDFELEKNILSLDRQFLHAKIIGFDHPTTGKYLEFSSKLPKDLENILKKLRNSNK